MWKREEFLFTVIPSGKFSRENSMQKPSVVGRPGAGDMRCG